MGLLSEFSRPSEWPRAAGILNGWHGLAWLWLHLVKSRLVPSRARTCTCTGLGQSKSWAHVFSQLPMQSDLPMQLSG